MKACPTQALSEPYMLNTKICLSLITQIYELPPNWILSKLEGRIYGCDVCQEVCPFNKTAPKIGDKAFLPTKFKPFPDLLELISMDVKRFIEVVGPTSAEWIGRSIIQKNAILGLINYNDSSILSHIKKIKNDNRPYIKEIAIFAENYIKGR